MILDPATISVVDRVRDADPAQVAALADSIAEIGLQSPITVAKHVTYRDGEAVDGWKLVAGLHRLEAVKSLGLVEIEAREIADDEILQKLWECDENLCRAELTPAQRAKFTAERKRWYEVRHPETRHGANRAPSGQFGHTVKDGFTEETAKRTGKSERDVRRDARRGSKIEPRALEAISGTQADTGKNLDALAKLPASDQLKVAKALAKGKPVPIAPEPLNEDEAREKWLASMLALWNRGSSAWRDEFLARVDTPVFERGAA